jgi:uncharacterized protein YjbJ (UPF0337 family)
MSFMSKYVLQGSWAEVRGKIKAKWAKLSDEDIDALHGNVDKLAGQLQKQYGYPQDKAKQELKEFKATL